MKGILLILLLLTIISAPLSYCQSNDGTKYILNAKPTSLRLNKNRFYEKGILPAKDIMVMDFRFDTTKIGYTDPGPFVPHYLKVKPVHDWASILNNYFKQNLDPASSNTLLIVIRDFWMREGLTEDLTRNKVVRRPWMVGNDDNGGVCKAALDVFLYKDSVCMPLFKVEDAFMNFVRFNTDRLDEWFFLPYDSVARRLIQKTIPESWQQGKTFRIETIREGYSQRFNKPVLQQPSFTKGVYLSFRDFCNNKVSVTEFRFKSGKVTDELYTGPPDNETLLKDYWGFYDGKQLFIHISFSAFPAVQCDRTWEVYGSKFITNISNNPQPGELIRVNKMDVFRKILQLNMETGKFY